MTSCLTFWAASGGAFSGNVLPPGEMLHDRRPGLGPCPRPFTLEFRNTGSDEEPQIKAEKGFQKVPVGEMEEHGGKYSWLACGFEVRPLEPWVHVQHVGCGASSALNDRWRDTAHHRHVEVHSQITDFQCSEQWIFYGIPLKKNHWTGRNAIQSASF